MTDEEQLFLVDLKANTQQFFSLFNEMEAEKLEVKKKVLALNHEIEKLKQDKIELNLKIEQLKIATHLLSGVDENREARHKINRLVREIDKCIALLNK